MVTRFLIVVCTIGIYCLAATGVDVPPSLQGANTIFSLRQSFRHGFNATHDRVSIINNRLRENISASASTLAQPLSLTLLTANADPVGLGINEPVAQQVLQSSSAGSIHVPALRPNVSDKSTVVNLAKMTSDSYYSDPGLPGWFNLSDGFNRTQSFGWIEDSLRGHVFANIDDSIVVVSFKGTTVDTLSRKRNRDRENDNLLFSCCCAEQRKDPYWYGKVCDCRDDTFSCSSTCLTQECGRTDRYYALAMEVVMNVTASYPNSQLWVVGHSLGGAIASLMGMTFNIPAVSYESPPDRLPAERLGLAVPPAAYPITYHFGNTADPVYMGACNGYTSACSIGGFAFESQCFTGRRCVYDTVSEKRWHMNVLNHRINTVIHDVLEAYDTVPECVADEECIDCYNWNYHL